MPAAFITLLLLIYPWHTMAAPGDELVVTGGLVNVRSAPSLDAPVVMRLAKGRMLTEISREGPWVEINTRRSDIDSAWIHSKLVTIARESVEAQMPDYQSAEEKTLFDLFNRALREMNENNKKETGNTYFQKAKNLGNGVVEVTATEEWLNASRESREKAMSEVFRIWDAAMVDRSSITVFIVNQNGERQMSMFR